MGTASEIVVTTRPTDGPSEIVKELEVATAPDAVAINVYDPVAGPTGC